MTTTTRTVTTTTVSDGVNTLFTVIEDSREPATVCIESGTDTVFLDENTLSQMMDVLTGAYGRVYAAETCAPIDFSADLA